MPFKILYLPDDPTHEKTIWILRHKQQENRKIRGEGVCTKEQLDFLEFPELPTHLT